MRKKSTLKRGTCGLKIRDFLVTYVGSCPPTRSQVEASLKAHWQGDGANISVYIANSTRIKC